MKEPLPCSGDHMTMATAACQQVCIIFNPGGPLKFLPAQRAFHSMRLFQPLWLLNRWAMIQKGKECRRGCACCWVVLKKKIWDSSASMQKGRKPLQLLCPHSPFTSQASGCHFVIYPPLHNWLIFVFPWFHLCRNKSQRVAVSRLLICATPPSSL